MTPPDLHGFKVYLLCTGQKKRERSIKRHSVKFIEFLQVSDARELPSELTLEAVREQAGSLLGSDFKTLQDPQSVRLDFQRVTRSPDGMEFWKPFSPGHFMLALGVDHLPPQFQPTPALTVEVSP